ncbi:MAG TPA: SIS domain-containing protein [Candidatus Acidoferrales bacterium]|nr:SIS domain-containing protein [Candidatus Acidoferrales bacterium]
MDMVEKYLGEMERALRALSRDDVRRVVGALFDAWRWDKMVWIIGNGGSAATASHMMNDLCKCTVVEGQPRFRAMALTDNVPLITAVANDVEYEEIFVEPLRTHMRGGDVLIAISGSGNSPNVLRAVAYAKEIAGLTIGLCGHPGGMLAKSADLSVIVPADRIGQQEDGHLILNHTIALALRERIELHAIRTSNAASAVAG